MGEGLLLLALVTLPAMLICYNVGIGEFTIGRTALIATWPVEWSMIRFLDRLAGSLAVDSADGDDGHLVSGTASH